MLNYKTALITGASSGIGAGFATALAAEGCDLVLVARSVDKLNALAEQLHRETGRRVEVVAADLTRPRSGATVKAAVDTAEAKVAILVNNAGFGLLGTVATLDPDGQRGIVDLNVTALLALTVRFLPDLRASRGKILNVASIASFMPGPGMAVYYASKAFVSAFSRALTEELKEDGVIVSVLHPGVTSTDFQARAGFHKAPKLERMPGASALSVAEAGYRGLMAGKRVIVPGLGNKVGALLLPLVPDAILQPIVYRFQRGRL